jgi:nucleotide-binding universal stress UspA family protein
MSAPILLCTDGSGKALRALAAGLDLLGRGHDFVLISVWELPDEESFIGPGPAGSEVSFEGYNDEIRTVRETATSAIDEVQQELSLGGADVHIASGDPGAVICQLAAELFAQAIVIGSRGRGGTKRHLLGTVSNHVVRNAPCSVVVTQT